MRCKVGDLALVVRCENPDCRRFVGRVVRIVRPCLCWPSHWEVDPPQFVPGDPRPTAFHDEGLRPIRPDDGADETLTWAGLPNETPTEIIRKETA